MHILSATRRESPDLLQIIAFVFLQHSPLSIAYCLTGCDV